MHVFRQFYGRLLAALYLLVTTSSYAGTISGISVSESSLVVSEEATYTFTFTPQTTVDNGMWCDGAYFWFDFDNDFTVSGASLVSITPSVTGMSIVGKNDGIGELRLWTSNSSAEITGGQQYTVVLSGVENPATPQTPVNHQIETGEGCSKIDTGYVTANDIVAGSTNPPSVNVQISDKSNLQESEGVIQYVADLNDHFVDIDGDTLSFSASSSDPTVVSVSLSGTNNKTLSLQAHKYGSANITVTATSTDGSDSDIFNVTTIGELTINSISSTSATAGQITDMTFNITLESSVSDSGGDGAYIYFDFPSGYGVDDSTIITVTSPAVSGITNRSTGSSNVWFIASASTIAPGTYTVTISNITNPVSAALNKTVSVDTRDGGGTTFDIGTKTLPAILTEFLAAIYLLIL